MKMKSYLGQNISMEVHDGVVRYLVPLEVVCDTEELVTLVEGHPTGEVDLEVLDAQKD